MKKISLMYTWAFLVRLSPCTPNATMRGVEDVAVLRTDRKSCIAFAWAPPIEASALGMELLCLVDSVLNSCSTPGYRVHSLCPSVQCSAIIVVRRESRRQRAHGSARQLEPLGAATTSLSTPLLTMDRQHASTSEEEGTAPPSRHGLLTSSPARTHRETGQARGPRHHHPRSHADFPAGLLRRRRGEGSCHIFVSRTSNWLKMGEKRNITSWHISVSPTSNWLKMGKKRDRRDQGINQKYDSSLAQRSSFQRRTNKIQVTLWSLAILHRRGIPQLLACSILSKIECQWLNASSWYELNLELRP
jgi:hypothetical protein